jgi:hypothetical protein
MPIIINGGSRRAGGWWSKHLDNQATNERVQLIDIVGLNATTMPDAFKEMYALSLGTKCDNYFYQANINPRADEKLTPAQWDHAKDKLLENLGLAGQPHFVVEHEKNGRTHRHIVVSRIDIEHMRAIPDSLTAAIHERTSRQLEVTFDLERGTSILTPDRDGPRPERGPKKWERASGERSGISPQDAKALVTELWQATDTGKALQAALEDRGWILARGDKTTAKGRAYLMAIDPEGGTHELARRVDKVKAAAVHARMADIDPAALPSVTEAKEQQQLRQQERTASAEMHAETARRYDRLRDTEREVQRAAFVGKYDELRAAEPPPEVLRVFTSFAHHSTEPMSQIWDRDATSRDWEARVGEAGIANAARSDAEQPRQGLDAAQDAQGLAEATQPAKAHATGIEIDAQQPVPNAVERDMLDVAEGALAAASKTTGRVIGGLAKFADMLGGVLSFLVGEPKLSPAQAVLAERAAEERAEANAATAAVQEVEARHAAVAEQQRSRDIAWALQLNPVPDPEEERFRSIMQRSAREIEREQENELER